MSEAETTTINKNLNAACLGIAGRQSELNEVALTYKFQGLDIDLGEVAARAAKHDLREATQFLHLPVGQFDLPICLGGDDAAFAKKLESLKPILEVAKAIKATQCVHTIEATSDELPYHENFERHRARVSELAKLLKEYGIRLGLGVSGAAAARGDGQYQFVQQADDLLAFIATLSEDNVGLALDTWNWHLAGGTVEGVQRLGVDKIVTVLVADISSEANLDTVDSTQRALPSKDGLVKLNELIEVLKSLDYKGPITLAPSPDSLRGSRDSVVRQAAKILDELWDPPPVVEAEEAEEAEEAAVASDA